MSAIQENHSSAQLRESGKNSVIMVMISFWRFYYLYYLILSVRLKETLKKPMIFENYNVSYRIEIAQPVFNKDHQAIPITSSTFPIVNYLSWLIEIARLRVFFHLLSIDGAAISVTLTSVLVVLITLWVSAILISNGTLEDICVGHLYNIYQQNIHISVSQKLWMTWLTQGKWVQ